MQFFPNQMVTNSFNNRKCFLFAIQFLFFFVFSFTHKIIFFATLCGGIKIFFFFFGFCVLNKEFCFLLLLLLLFICDYVFVDFYFLYCYSYLLFAVVLLRLDCFYYYYYCWPRLVWPEWLVGQRQAGGRELAFTPQITHIKENRIIKHFNNILSTYCRLYLNEQGSYSIILINFSNFCFVLYLLCFKRFSQFSFAYRCRCFADFAFFLFAFVNDVV